MDLLQGISAQLGHRTAVVEPGSLPETSSAPAQCLWRRAEPAGRRQDVIGSLPVPIALRSRCHRPCFQSARRLRCLHQRAALIHVITRKVIKH